MPSDEPSSGRCYCGASRVRAAAAPLIVTYCHCSDCRRLSGAPVSAFAAFDRADLTLDPPRSPGFSRNGVERWFCPDCGAQLAATYDYLPGQIYVPLGLLDQAAELPPEAHSHAGSALPWLHIEDDAARHTISGRDTLNAAKQ